MTAELESIYLPPEEKVAEARRKIQELVDADHRSHRPFHTIRGYNVEIKRLENARYGDQSITNLLPSNSRQFLSIIMNLLVQQGIRTKQDLIYQLTDNVEEIGSLDGLDPFRAKVILAMRDLAIAEMSQIPKKPLQNG